MITAGNDVLLGKLVTETVDLAKKHVLSGGIPFSAMVVDSEGTILGTGVNRVIENCDPTAHAEVVAIRNACKHLSQASLSGVTLIASGEPCGFCYANALLSGVQQVIFALDRHEAAEAGFDYRLSYNMYETDPINWAINVFKHKTANAYSPFDLWLQSRP